MIYLIGGPPRVGKSTLAQKLTTECGIPFISTDVLLFMVHDTLPDLNLKDPYEAIPKKFFPFLDSFIRNTILTVPDYVIEGDTITPAIAQRLGEKYELRACFLGSTQTTLENIRRYTGHNDWMSLKNEAELAVIPASIMRRSQALKEECEKRELAFFDTSAGFDAVIKTAFTELTR